MPAELDVHLVCDNYGTHKTPAIKAWLARHPRFHMHFTPTGSSWINQVERWFGYLTDQTHPPRRPQDRCRPSKPTSAPGSSAGTTDPKPFVWTKTAEEILDSLATIYADEFPAQDTSAAVAHLSGGVWRLSARPPWPEVPFEY